MKWDLFFPRKEITTWTAEISGNLSKFRAGALFKLLQKKKIYRNLPIAGILFCFTYVVFRPLSFYAVINVTLFITYANL